MASGILALLGVALGSALTWIVQVRMAERAERFARTERERDEQRSAFSAFAAAAMDARRAQLNRWWVKLDGRGQRYDHAKAESYVARTAARRELYRVQMLSRDSALTDAAEKAVKSLALIPRGATQADVEARAEETRLRIEEFVRRAGEALRYE